MTDRAVRISTEHELERFVQGLEEMLSDMGYAESARAPLLIACWEIAMNALRHGNGFDEKKRVTIRTDIRANESTISIEDEGNGFDPASVPPPPMGDNLRALLETGDEAYAHGRGIWLSRHYLDDLKYSNGGRRATLYARRDYI